MASQFSGGELPRLPKVYLLHSRKIKAIVPSNNLRPLDLTRHIEPTTKSSSRMVYLLSRNKVLKNKIIKSITPSNYLRPPGTAHSHFEQLLFYNNQQNSVHKIIFESSLFQVCLHRLQHCSAIDCSAKPCIIPQSNVHSDFFRVLFCGAAALVCPSTQSIIACAFGYICSYTPPSNNYGTLPLS